MIDFRIVTEEKWKNFILNYPTELKETGPYNVCGCSVYQWVDFKNDVLVIAEYQFNPKSKSLDIYAINRDLLPKNGLWEKIKSIFRIKNE